MKSKLILGFLVMALIAVPLFAAACGEEGGGGVTPGDWGEPEYGGTLMYRAQFIDVICNPLDPRSVQYGAWIESLFTDDMTVDRDEFGFGANFFPLKYRAGQLAESWSMPDDTTIVVNLRQNVTWQDTPPTNGRPFTSADVVFTYDKVLGVGEFAGMDPDPFLSAIVPSVTECVATGDYTVEFHLNSAGPFKAYEIVNPWMSIAIAPREFYDLTEEEQADWHNAAGTGAFMLTDYVPGTSMTCAKNPDYYGVDARYDDNPLPYTDAFKVVVIPDMSSALSALRTGQIDLLTDARVYPTLQETLMLAETDPQIVHFTQNVMGPGIFYHWNQDTGTIDPPFDDINIRKAMQMALDLDLIAETYYQGTVDPTPCAQMSPLAGDWSPTFDEWPSELQDEYTYNLEEAQALMADAGYGVSNPLECEIFANAEDYPEVLLIVQDMLDEIGVTMNINAVAMMEARPVIMEGDYEILWVSVTGNTNSSPADCIRNWYSGKFERIGQGGGVIDPVYDEFVAEFDAATTEAACKEVFQEAELYWLEQHWAAITFPSWSHQFHQPWIEGYLGERVWSTMTWTYIASMWIDEDIMVEYLGEVRD